MRWILIFTLLAGLLIYGVLGFPYWGDPKSPAATHVSDYYIEQTMADTSVPNVVTAVLADYRGYDTMFETIVIFTSGLVCIVLLAKTRKTVPTSRVYRHVPTGITLRIEKGGKLPDDSDVFERIDSVWVPHDLVIRTTCRIVIPFIQVFALYVIAHGHHSPGGGFQGGVIFGASLVLYAIGFNLRALLGRMTRKIIMLIAALGVLVYAGLGLSCILFQGNYLDYSVLAPVFGTDPVVARSHGILIVEIGVGIAVMAVMVILYTSLSSAGRYDEGL
ncbi:MAG: Na(+)/H(+) antiporter subunit B [Desulfobacterales bacterium]|nr:Na(+)/H(+) antiporter subunit B [Desulfobacterales bacterium]